MNNLPLGYKPYQKIRICSNTIIGGGVLFSIGGQFPMLIGEGELPKIWLSALENPISKSLVNVVEESRSVHEWVEVEQVGVGYIVKVFGKVVMAVSVGLDGVMEISSLDLRILGFNIFGDAKILTMSGMSFQNTSFEGASVIVGFD
ncbi:hypothetical protein [Pseudomonas asiatica]|uniref:hypothetical protein n=1 Tax=Pseudomonas asiatica TaxID=2219225 RepID=UPI001AAF42F8|nr:hypothetical protein [Pseudomonas asiatica]MBO2891173.1 hypothetical protein [Pseudomonas asiatica]